MKKSIIVKYAWEEEEGCHAPCEHAEGDQLPTFLFTQDEGDY